MANQTAGNVMAALKREVDIGVAAAGGAGAEQLRVTDSPGLGLARSAIESGEKRRDQLRSMGRLGGKSVAGSYNTELNVGGYFDLLLESIARGTWGAPATHATISAGTQLRQLLTPTEPIYHSYTIEQYDVDIDLSELFLGCRLTELSLALRPNEMATAGWTFAGLDRQVLAEAASPYFTDPAVTEGLSLIADDSAIYYKGVQIAIITGLDITLTVANALQPVIGAFVSPDVFMNDLTVSASLTAIRQDLQALEDFDAETEFEVRAVLTEPGVEPNRTFGVVLPRTKISNINAPFIGGDAAKVETRDLMVAAPMGTSRAVEFYSSGDTPVAV